MEETNERPSLPPGARNEKFRELYPFDGTFLSLGSEVSMHYLDEGKGRETLLCLHGNPTWSFFYRDVVKAFRDDCRCVVPDHIGCGFSTKPQDYDYTLSRHIENLEKLVAHLDLSGITLVVHDWGGAIGMGFATKHPELVKRIVVMNTAAFPSKHIPWRINICRLPVFGELVIRGMNGFAWPAVYMATTQSGGLPKPVRDGFLLPYGDWRSRIALHRFVRDIPMQPKHPTYSLLADIGEKLAILRDRPALICWGGRDFCFNDHFLQRWRQEFPQAKVERFADAGHYLLEDALNEVIKAMRAFIG